MYPACNQAGMNRNCLSMLAVARNAATGVDNKGMPVLLTKQADDIGTYISANNTMLLALTKVLTDSTDGATLLCKVLAQTN